MLDPDDIDLILLDIDETKRKNILEQLDCWN